MSEPRISALAIWNDARSILMDYWGNYAMAQ
mgnify:CR=1 FL=1